MYCRTYHIKDTIAQLKKKSIHTPILSDICFGIFFFYFFFCGYFLRKILNEFLMHIKTSVDVG